MAQVTIAIPSFRRPNGLARLLASLAALRTQAQVRVLVGDNDAEGRAAEALCADLAPSYPFPLEAIVVRERGIAQNRSALVAKALDDPAMDYLAMLDDDETVAPNWLDAMLAAARDFGADAVEGPVFAVTDDGTPLPNFSGVAGHRGASGPVPLLLGAGNILIARGVLQSMPAPHFDPAFALTGGEDRDFFLRLAACGARSAWCAEATCTTEVPMTRRGAWWSLARAYRCGNSDMRIFLKYHASLRDRVGETGKILAMLLLGPILSLALLAVPAQGWRMLRRVSRAAGKAAALAGVEVREYAVIHGE